MLKVIDRKLTCKSCREKFWPIDDGQRLCSLCCLKRQSVVSKASCNRHKIAGKKRTNEYPARECDSCGRVYIPTSGNQKVCGVRCKRDWSKRLDRSGIGRCKNALHNSRYQARKSFIVPCLASVDEIHAAYTGQCDICMKSDDGERGLHLDHDHKTGRFRGWLCHQCNIMIGMAGDNPALLAKATDWLRSSSSVPDSGTHLNIHTPEAC